MNTIKKVYDQLTKEELGTDRARVKVKETSEELIIISTNHTARNKPGKLVYVCQNRPLSNIHADGPYEEWFGHAEVEWIGNKPKTSEFKAQLHRAIIEFRIPGQITPGIYQEVLIEDSKKDFFEMEDYFVGWITDQDSYPQSDQK